MDGNKTNTTEQDRERWINERLTPAELAKKHTYRGRNSVSWKNNSCIEC